MFPGNCATAGSSRNNRAGDTSCECRACRARTREDLGFEFLIAKLPGPAFMHLLQLNTLSIVGGILDRLKQDYTRELLLCN